MKLRTWHIELAVVGGILSAVNLLAKRDLVEWVGSAAVLTSFAHSQVTDRLAERESKRESPEDCHLMARRYFVSKEILWVVYFLAVGAWSPLIGCALFLIYPVWRAWYRRAR